MNLAGFGRSKVCRKILCLHSPILKVHSTKTSGQLRFSNEKLASSSRANIWFPSLDPGSVFKDYDVHRVQSLPREVGGPG